MFTAFAALCASMFAADTSPRERTSFNSGWRFTKDDPLAVGESLSYERIKEWVLPTGDELLNYHDPAPRVRRPEGNPAGTEI